MQRFRAPASTPTRSVRCLAFLVLAPACSWPGGIVLETETGAPVPGGGDTADAGCGLGTTIHPAADCAAILSACPTAATGAYWIDAAGDGSALEVTCDMDRESGGWVARAPGVGSAVRRSAWATCLGGRVFCRLRRPGAEVERGARRHLHAAVPDGRRVQLPVDHGHRERLCRRVQPHPRRRRSAEPPVLLGHRPLPDGEPVLLSGRGRLIPAALRGLRLGLSERQRHHLVRQHLVSTAPVRGCLPASHVG